MTSAAQIIDTGVTAQRALPADVAPQWPHCCKTRDGVEYHIRPLRPDKPLHDYRLMKGFGDSAGLLALSGEPSAGLLNRMVRVDYRREMALVAVAAEKAAQTIIGVARYRGNPAFCELAIAVADDWQSRGVGSAIARLLFAHAKSHGVRRIYGLTSADNLSMLKLAHHLQMTLRRSCDNDAVIEAWRTL
jgi:acetyltransferase